MFPRDLKIEKLGVGVKFCMLREAAVKADAVIIIIVIILRLYCALSLR